MKRKRIVTIQLRFAILLMVITLFTIAQAANEHYWSKSATAIRYKPGAKEFILSSPNKKFSIIVSNYGLTVTSNGRKLPGIPNEGIAPVSEIQWSPDSRAFFVNWDNGGAIGTWEIEVYLVSELGVRRIDVTKEAVEEIQKYYPCMTRELPNLAAIGWTRNFHKLFIVGQVPPHSSCPKMGTIVAYELAIPGGHILQKYNRSEIPKKWKSQIVFPH